MLQISTTESSLGCRQNQGAREMFRPWRKKCEEQTRRDGNTNTPTERETGQDNSGKGAEMSRKAPGEHQEADFEVAPFDCQRSLRPSDRALQGLQESYGLRPLGSRHPAMPSNVNAGVGASTPTPGSTVGLASAVGTLRGSGENRSRCPPPQLPANRSYKYSPA